VPFIHLCTCPKTLGAASFPSEAPLLSFISSHLMPLLTATFDRRF